MEPITSGAYAPAAVAGTRELPRIQKPEQSQAEPPKPWKDEYIPEEEHVPTGLYWPGKDEDSQSKIYFDAPEESPETDEPAHPSGGKKAEQCTANTDQVDREIEKLKQKRKELKQRLNMETDEGKKEPLERQLAQVERELRQKDNDAYRRQHTVVTKTTAP